MKKELYNPKDVTSKKCQFENKIFALNENKKIVKLSKKKILRNIKNLKIINFALIKKLPVKKISKLLKYSNGKVYSTIQSFKKNPMIFFQKNRIKGVVHNLKNKIDKEIEKIVKTKDELLNSFKIQKYLENELKMEFDKKFRMSDYLKSQNFTYKKVYKKFYKSETQHYSILNFLSYMKSIKFSKKKMYSFDITTFQCNTNNLKSWSPKGQMKRISMKMKYYYIHILGILSFDQTLMIQIVQGKLSSHLIYTFFESLFKSKKYRSLFDSNSYILIDNANINRSKALKLLFRDNRVFMIYLPSKMPLLNPIEHVWRDFKKTIKQVFVNKKEEIFNMIIREVSKIKERNIKGYKNDFLCEAIGLLNSINENLK